VPTAASAPPVSLRAFWTGFRGPLRDGVYTGGPIRTSWTRPPRILWKQPVGEGHGSFAAANGLAFTIEQRRSQEVIAAYEIDTGREVWTHGWEARFRESMGGDGPRATPAWDDGRVFALGALGELRVVDAATGTLVWRTDILADNGADNVEWAMAASPLVVDDLVIVLPGGPNGRSVVAYDKRTGQRRWSALDDDQAYTAPMVATLNGRRQLVIVSARRAAGLTLDGGRLIWEFPWRTDHDVNAAQPIVLGSNRLFLSAGYGHGAAVIELTPAGDGDTARVVWQNTRMKNKFASSVLHDGHIYGFDESILGCIDAATGELRWKGGRYGYGQLVLAGDQVLVLTERGELAVVKATPASHQELALIPVIEGRTWNHPALEQGRLLVRNGNEMAAVDLRP
jgi:outer membrane protein assembly factor BamB